MSLWFRNFLLSVLLGISGCGYTLSHRVKNVFDGPKGLYVPVFSNQTEEMGAETVFTNALLRELTLHETLKLVNSKESSPLELRGTLEKITYQPTALYAPSAAVNKLQPYSNVPDQINLVATVRVDLFDREAKKVIWTQTVNGSRIVSAYLERTGDKEAASGFGTYTQSLIDGRYSDIARDMMRDLYDSMLETL